jgi:hypothetical protein
MQEELASITASDGAALELRACVSLIPPRAAAALADSRRT